MLVVAAVAAQHVAVAVVRELRARDPRLAREILHARPLELDRIEAGRPGSFERPLFKATEFFKRRGIIVLISDCYEDPQKLVDALKPLSYGGNDLIVVHILDQAEIDFPYEGATSFQDLETGQKMPVVPEKLRAQYRQLVQEHIAALSKKCSENRIDYALFNTATPIDQALFKFLAMRHKMSKAR